MATPTTSGGYASVPLSPYENLNTLLSLVRWSSPVISYSIPAAGSVWSRDPNVGYGPSGGDGEPWSPNFGFLGAGEIVRFKSALQKWANVAAIQFTEVPDNQTTVGDIRIAYSYTAEMARSAAHAYLPFGEPTSGDIWINAKTPALRSGYLDSSDEYHTLIHELGHSLGLKHPFSAASLNSKTISPLSDTLVLSVMSYSGEPGQSSTSLSYAPTTPMLYDIEAIQHMYGANRNYNAGDTTYRFDDSTTYMETIWDGGGNNTISYTGNQPSLINLNEGSGSSIGKAVYTIDSNGRFINYVENVWIAFDTKITGAQGGSGGDYFFGNDFGNSLVGGSGNDSIFAGNGNDRIEAGKGNDLARGSDGDDIFVGVAGKDALYGGTGRNILIADNALAQLHVTTLRNNAFFVRSDDGDMAIVRDVQTLQARDASVALNTLGITGNVDLGLVEIYVAAFRRAPESSGYDYWMKEIASKGLARVADTIFSLDIVQQVYAANLTANEFVTAIYKNVFDKLPDTEGLAYWTQQLAAGSRGQLVVNMTTAGLGVSDGVDGKDFFQNRVDWGQYAVGYQATHNGGLSVAHLSELTAVVNDDPMTLITLIGNAESGIAL